MKIQICWATFENVLEVLEHDLSITVWVHERQEFYLMHLKNEFSHVGACQCWEKNKFEVDSLDLRLNKVKFVLEELEENMVLMKVKLWETLQVWIVEASEEYVALKGDILRHT